MALPTVSLNETTPAGGSYIRDGDDRIREYKIQIREILTVDHYFPSSGQNDACGRHKWMTLIETDNIGSGVVGGVGVPAITVLGGQTVSGKSELVYTDEDNNDVSLTSLGVPTGPFKSGDWILSTVATARAGWTNVSATYSNKFMRINATPLSTGGADTHTHTGPSHTHDVTIPKTGWSRTTVGADTISMYDPAGDVTMNTRTLSAAAGAAGTGTTSSGDNVPAYVQVVVFQKD